MENYRFINLIIQLRSSFWFIPNLLIAASIVLAWATVTADTYLISPGSFPFNWVNNIGPSGARAVLSTIAGSTITVAGVIFSIAMVVLTMASGQFGPRLIPTFLRIGKIQFGIGLFIGTFIYCLLMLTFVPEDNNGELLPVWGVLVGMVLGVSAFIVLIMLIHEIVTFIQAPVVADRVAQDMLDTFERVFPEVGSDGAGIGLPEVNFSVEDGQPVRSTTKGYVQTINYSALTEVARCNECVIKMDIKPGNYIIEGHTIATVCGFHGDIEQLKQKCCEQIQFGQTRTLAQDAEYSVDQMVEIAVRALSPGVNDPFTAINCIDKLSGVIGQLGNRRMQPIWRLDSEDQPRLLTVSDTFESIVEAAFDQIRQNASTEPAVLIRLVDAIGRLGKLKLDGGLRNALALQLDIVASTDLDGFAYQHDRDQVSKRIETAKHSYSMSGS